MLPPFGEHENAHKINKKTYNKYNINRKVYNYIALKVCWDKKFIFYYDIPFFGLYCFKFHNHLQYKPYLYTLLPHLQATHINKIPNNPKNIYTRKEREKNILRAPFFTDLQNSWTAYSEGGKSSSTFQVTWNITIRILLKSVFQMI